MEQQGILTQSDHERLGAWLKQVLDSHKRGVVTSEGALAALAQVIGAIDIRNIGEVRVWLSGKNGVG